MAAFGMRSMSNPMQHPIRFLLSDMDGTLLLPDHSLNQRTIEAVRSLREAGVLFSLATGRPPRAMLQQIEALGVDLPTAAFNRSEEHTSELQSLMRISYAVFCLKKKKNNN